MEFPNEITQELLLRMPVKSVMRFKCVSNEWNNLISDPTFRRNYQSRHGKKGLAAGFFYNRVRPGFSWSGPPGVSPTMFINTTNVEREELKCLDYLNEFGYVLASSKGLLLLSRNPMSYHVYDLVSKKQIKLPRTLKKYRYTAVGFICREHQQGDPTSHHHHLSYKVVCIGGTFKDLCYAKSTTMKVETYSSKTEKWAKSIMTAASVFCLGPQITAEVIGGIFYWLEFGDERLVGYNPEDPKGFVKLIELPWDVRVDFSSIKGFGGSTEDGCLQFYNIKMSIDVWILNSIQEDVVERSRWILAHRISYAEIGITPSYLGPVIGHTLPLPIAISPWNPNIIFLHTTNDEIVSYNQTDRKIEIISSYPFDAFVCFPRDHVPFQWPVWPCL